MSMKSLSTLGVAEEAPGALSCLMDRVGAGREWRSLQIERSRPGVRL